MITLIRGAYSVTRTYVKTHPYISILALVVVFGCGYWLQGKLTSTAGETLYVLGAVERGTIVASVSASGQVVSSDQIDVKPRASGDITWVGVNTGDTVRVGQAIAQIDDANAKQSVADAEQSLAQSKLQFQKDTAQAPIDYQKSLDALASAKTELSNTYNDTYNTLSTAFLDLPAAVSGMQNTLYGYDLSTSKSQWNVDAFRNIQSDTTTIRTFADVAERDYKLARAKYDQAVVDYKVLTRYSSFADLEKHLTSSIDTTTAIAQALQSELNLLDAVTDNATVSDRGVNTVISTLRSNTRVYLATANSNLSSMLNQQKSLDSTKQSITNNERSIEIYKIGNPDGNNPISLQSSQYSIADQGRKLQQLKDTLSDYVITAPFSGTVAVLNVKKYDTVSTGTAVATLITNQKVAQLSLNEVDATKITVGDKSTLSFDAIDGLTLTGSVIEMSSIGTVSQGVVSYTIKIGFDSNDSRVKPGMTVNAAIITAAHQNVLIVPASAIKTQGGASFIQIFSPPIPGAAGNQGVFSATPPQQIAVEVGLSDDTNTEILSGVSGGEQIVVRTIAGTAQTTQTSAPSILGAGGIRTGGGATRTGNATFIQR
jgi:HlyD family secretion protein